MQIITIKITYYDKENEMRTIFLEKEYDDKTTIYELLEGVPNRDLLICENTSFGGDRKAIRFLIIDNKCHWLIPYEECLVKDYINTYFNLNEYRPIEFNQIDGIGAVAPNGVFDYVSKILEIVTALEYTLKLKKWIEKHLIVNVGHVGFYDLDKTITYKNTYTLNEFCFEFDIDLDCAKILLEFFGYCYFEKEKMYFYVPAIHDKNINKFYQKELLG